MSNFLVTKFLFYICSFTTNMDSLHERIYEPGKKREENANSSKMMKKKIFSILWNFVDYILHCDANTFVDTSTEHRKKRICKVWVPSENHDYYLRKREVVILFQSHLKKTGEDSETTKYAFFWRKNNLCDFDAWNNIQTICI